MSFGTILFMILIRPLYLVFEIIYNIANRYINHPGLAIIVLSLIGIAALQTGRCDAGEGT